MQETRKFGCRPSLCYFTFRGSMHESSASTTVLKRDYSGVELNRCIDHSGRALRP